MNQRYCINCMTALGSSPVCSHCGTDNSLPHRTAPYHLPPHTVLAQRYQTGKVLGEGGFGITYIGMDTVLSKRVAVKEFYPSGVAVRNSADTNTVSVPDERKRYFQRGVDRVLLEAKSVAAFSDEEGIVNVQDYFQENGTAYIVMDFLDGENLREYVSRHGVFAYEELVTLLMPVMKGLKDMHAKGIIHRDISPDNIILTKKGQLKLTDFGSAYDYTDDKRTKAVVLKQGYAPEEQYRADSVQGPPTDIYALCATIYYCISGVTPVSALKRMTEDTLRRPSQLGVDIRPSREKALMHGLAVLAKNRTPDMSTLMRELHGSGAHAPVSPAAAPEAPKAPPASPNEYTHARRNRQEPLSALPTKSFRRQTLSPRRRLVIRVLAIAVPSALVLALIIGVIAAAGNGSGSEQPPATEAPTTVNIQELLSGIDSRPSLPSAATAPSGSTAATTEAPRLPLTAEQAKAHRDALGDFFLQNAVNNDKQARYGDVISLRKIYHSENKHDSSNCFISFAYCNDTLGYYKVMYLPANSFTVTDNGLVPASTVMTVSAAADSISNALDQCWFLKSRYSSSGQFIHTAI